MPRRGGSKLQRREADKIAAKLGADVKGGSAHDHAMIRWEGVAVTSFGLRRGSKSKHGHIPGQLFISQSQTVSLASCTISKDEYFKILKDKGKLPADKKDKQNDKNAC